MARRLSDLLRLCTGCNEPFLAENPRQIRCQDHCGLRHGATDHSRRAERAKAHHVEFVGLDGEGIGADDGHRYVLLSVGTESLHRFGERLTTSTIFEFLWERYEANPNATYVGFALGYDIAQWLRDLPEERARMLYDPTRRLRTKSGGNPLPFPVRWREWEFDIIPGKRFKLRLGNKGPWLYVCDTFSFWQMAFLKAIDPTTWQEPVVTAEEYGILVRGKKARSTARWSTSMVRYNRLENVVLARLMDRLNAGYVAMDVRLKRHQWIGPGQAAQAWMHNIGAPTSSQIQEVTPAPVVDAARASYYGGWFETPTFGIVRTTTHEYDINSAYPWVIQSLPCLLHGRWTSDESGKWCLLRAVMRGSNPHLGPHMHRSKKDTISRRSTIGWIWRHELEASERAGLVDATYVTEAWSYHPCDCRPPFRAIAGLYEERLRVGKTSPHGKALKLVYNSAYGKLAQSIGHPRYANPLYASLITAGCRTAILDAIATHPDGPSAVVMVATDAVYFDSPHPSLPTSPKLGEWDHQAHENLTVMMPGVYWDDRTRELLNSGETPTLKSRGVSGRDLAQVVSSLDLQWSTFEPGASDWPTESVVVDFTLVSPQLALDRNDWATCGAVRNGEVRVINSNPVAKRDPRTARYERGRVVTSPWMLDPMEDEPVSKPYDKTIGMVYESRAIADTIQTIEGPFNLIEALSLRNPQENA